MAETNKMLIDATHPEETRVVVLRGGRVEEFDYESAARKQLRGNIYLAKVTRVEPSLQAAFVDYGGNRHGFLAFNEIHPDYYQIPVADRQALIEEEAAAEAAEEAAAEARAEARARREAARAAAKAARKQARQETSGEHDEDDDDEDDDDIDHGDDHDDDDEDDEVTEVNAQTSAPHADDDLDNHADDRSDDHAEDHHDDVDESVPSATQNDAAIGAPTTRTLAEDHGLANEERLSTPAGLEVNEAGAVGGHPEPTEASQAMVDKAGTEDTGNARDEDDASDAELDRDSPEPHGLVEDQGVHEISTSSDMERPNGNAEEPVDQVGSEDAMEELPSRPRRRPRSYKIQEVIKRRQVVLIQVVKEERGNKGAALTTYLSLAGRYTVLMPNTARGGGISRKITQPQDRKRLKAIAAELDVPEGMGLIIRTAGAARTKQEIKRDFEYLLRLWESVRELTLQSTAPSLVYEEGNLIKRSIRDLYNKDVEELIVAGDDAHRDAKDFMRMLMPSHAKNVIHYKQPDPLFTRFQIERQLNAMFSPYVTLKSGGYLVINQTEALVAIDVNSGKATREFSIEETALVTNCEAAEEIARQLKLRDLAGLIVIDFIDMEEKRNNRTVERRLKEALKHDRARIQVGRISHFGLLEMSRQRLRTGVLEGSTSQCPHCQGTGIIRSVESVALAVLRGLEDAVMAGSRTSLTAVTTPTVALYILNKKRAFINDMEARHGLPITVEGSDKIQGANFAIEKGAAPAHHHRRPEKAAVNMNWGFENEDDEIGDEAEEINAKAEARDERPSRSERSDRGEGESRRRSRRRGRRSEREDRDERRLPANDDYSDQDEDRAETAQGGEDGADDKGAEEARTNRQPSEASENGESSEGQRRRRRRGRRGGRRNRERLEQSTQADNTTSSDDEGRDDVTQSGNETAAGDLANHETSPVHGEGAAIQPATSLTAMTQPVAPAAGGETEPQPDHTVKTDNVATDGAGTDRGETEGEVTGGGKANLAVTVLDPGGQEATTAPLNTESGATEAASLATSEPAVVNDTPTLSDPPVETRQDHTTPPDAPPRTPRGELAATAPKIERVVVSPGTGASSDENAPDTPEAPVRKGWWQRRFGN